MMEKYAWLGTEWKLGVQREKDRKEGESIAVMCNEELDRGRRTVKRNGNESEME